MKRAAIPALFCLSLSLSALPAQAAEGMLTNAALCPVRAVALASAIVVGTPVAIFKRVGTRVVEYTSEWAEPLGGKENIPPVLFASVAGVPAGLFVGTAEGVYYGSKNALENFVDKPFSAESFSMADVQSK